MKIQKVGFNYTYPWTYPSNWIRNIKGFFKQITDMCQRAKYGVTRRDCWDLDAYMLRIFKNGLIMFNKDNIGYPARDEANTLENWAAIVDRMIELIGYLEKDPIDYPEPNALYNEGVCNKRWTDAIKKAYKEREEYKKEFSELLVKWGDHLWW